ncbi:MAG: sigma-70 family RNA polymerase sigma factor [Opitutaceae bacterium]|nr:sigma-70 family RNA polymerase sigma factor [Opitutaceae bacterium]
MDADQDLLRRYVKARAQDAFTELVQRHTAVVYAAAMRQTFGDRALSEEVAQRVFTTLARKAHDLCDHPALVAWLYSSTRLLSLEALRTRRRHQERLVKAAELNEGCDMEQLDWTKVAPLVDEALCALREEDRQVVILRYFNDLPYRDIGMQIGVTENTARMRAERALEKLRVQLGRRGISSTSAALSLVLVTHAAPPAPAPLVDQLASMPIPFAKAPFLTLVAMKKLTLVGSLLCAGVVLTTVALTREKNVGPADSTEVQTLAKSETSKAAVASLAEKIASRRREVRTGTTPDNLVRDRGIQTPEAALETFTWACYTADVEAIARQVYFDGDGLKRAEALLVELPESLKSQWKTAERMCAFLTAADCLAFPPPSDASILKTAQMSRLSPTRVVFRKPGATSGGHEFEQTQEGWKRVFPELAVEDMLYQVLRTNPTP